MNVAILQFIYAKGAGDAALRKFFTYARNHGDDAACALCENPISLASELKLKPEVAKNIKEAKTEAEEIAIQLDLNNITLVRWNSENYPARLLSILQNNAPAVLFVKGNCSLLNAPGAGFCGSRKASEKGLGITARCASQLAEVRLNVVSGYAHGVDMAAHKSALEHGGTTVFVLVEGILRFQVKNDIADLLTSENHLFVSQFPPRLTWSGRNAMKRNSTIIGLSDAMILVESGMTGGTFAAGEETLKRKRPLFVIDYAAPGPSAEANPHFITKGGQPIRGRKDGTPSLDGVKEVIKAQSWKNMDTDSGTLFD
ncbi:DNA-processing protein DprA [Pontiellaceae bacterium B12219]|nr:DNA-processing protein DprA [Pontiellaceae bacterium B12219]